MLTSLDHLLGVDTGPWVDGLSLDVQEVLGEDWGTLVNGLAGAVEYTTYGIRRKIILIINYQLFCRVL